MNQQFNLTKVKNFSNFFNKSEDEEFLNERHSQNETLSESRELDFFAKRKHKQLNNVGLSFIFLSMLLLYVCNVAAEETFGEMLGDLSIFDITDCNSEVPDRKNITHLFKVMEKNNEKIEFLRQSLQEFEKYLKEFIDDFMKDQH